jgi:hypothetical protein
MTFLFSQDGSLDFNTISPIAFISISLKSRSSRLDFVYWLSTCMQHKDNNMANLQFFGLLSEGGSDVTIVFYSIKKSEVEEKSENAHIGGGISEDVVSSVFNFQERIYNHFLVDRTELILCSSCLDAVAESLSAQKGTENFSIIARFKLAKNANADGRIVDYNKKFIKIISEFYDVKNNAHNCSEIGCSKIENCDKKKYKLVRTPGRTDFSLYFKCKWPLYDQESRDALYGAISPFCDDVLTVVSKVVPPDKCGLLPDCQEAPDG